MTTDKRQLNIRLSDVGRDLLTKLQKLWKLPYQTETLEKVIAETWKREQRK